MAQGLLLLPRVQPTTAIAKISRSLEEILSSTALWATLCCRYGSCCYSPHQQKNQKNTESYGFKSKEKPGHCWT